MSPPDEIFDRVPRFSTRACRRWTDAGIARSRLILDPGMGFFLGTDPETSLTVLRRLPELKARFRLPLLVSVSRKSFLRQPDRPRRPRSRGRQPGGGTFCGPQGADYIRTHAPAALADGLKSGKPQ